MAETLRIEIPIETIDKTEPEISNLVKKLGKVGEAAEKAGGSTEQAGKKVTKFDESAEKTQKSLAKWAKEKYEILLEAKEKISPILSILGRGLKNIAGKTWRITMRAADFVTAPIRGIFNLLRNPLLQAGAVLGISFGMKDTIDTYKSFEAAMSQVAATMGKTKDEVNELEDFAIKMGSKTAFSASEAAEGLNILAMSGLTATEQIAALPTVLNLASAGALSLNSAASYVTATIKGFSDSMENAEYYADLMAKGATLANTDVNMLGTAMSEASATANSYSQTADNMTLSLLRLAEQNVTGSEAATALNRAMMDLYTPTSSAKKELDRLGVSAYDINGKARDLNVVIDELSAAIKEMDDDEKNATKSAIFTTYGLNAFSKMTVTSTEKVDEFREALKNATGSAAQQAETQLDNLSGSITLLQSAAEGVKISFGKRLSPYIRNFVDWLAEQMPAVGQGLDEFMDFVDRKIEKLQAKFREVTAGSEWQNADFFGKVKIAWDEFIVEPFSGWWNDTGKAKVASIAEDIGGGLGSGLKYGIMALLGIDLSDTVDEASSIGLSFARGFSEGFDFDLIKSKLWEGFKNLLSDAGKLLPGGESAGLSSVISAALLAKIASPLISLGGGAFNIGRMLFGSSAGGTSLASGLLGSAGAGTGLLGFGANTAIGLGAGNLAGGASLSAGALSAVGLGSVAGGVAGAVSVGSGILDMYKAVKSDNKDESDAYGESGAWKVGGATAGAVAGAAIGSVIPGLGTAVGGLIGFGVGGIAGWIKGNKIKDEYEENLKLSEEAAAKAQKVFEETGLSIDEVKFKNKALTQAMNDSEVSAEQFAQMFQEECANVMKEAFGDVHLSLTEVKALAEKITFGEMKEGLEAFQTAAANTNSSLSALKSSMTDLKKENWRMNLGKVVSESDADNYKQSVGSFADASKKYIEDVHYESANALKLLRGDSAYTRGIDIYYGNLESEIDSLTQQLDEALSAALEDGVISTEKIRLHDGTLQLSEAEEIESIQNQIAEITGKVASARNEAEFEMIGVKHSGAALDVESFASLQEEMNAYVESASETFEDALASTLADLKLRREDGNLPQGQYDTMAQRAVEEYQGHIQELSIQVQSFNMDSISEAFGDKLDGILPDLEGDLSDRMAQAMDKAFSIQPDVEAWTPEDVKKWFGLDKLDEETFETIFSELKQSAAAVPQMLRSALFEEAHGSKMMTSTEKWLNMNIRDTDTAADYSEVGSSVVGGVGDAIMNADMSKINSAVDNLKTNTDGYVNTAFSAGVSTTMPVNITAQYNLLNPTADITASGGASGTATITASVSSYSAAGQGNAGASQGVSKHAAGGFVTGRQLSWLAEEGYGEFVIPTNPSRRARALELYEQAGTMLGVGAHAEGGFVGGSYDSFSSDRKENALENSGSSEGSYYDSGSQSTDAAGNSVPVQINVNMAPEINIQSSAGGNGEDIAGTVVERILGMVDELSGEMASRLMDVFSNMPMEGV